MKSSKKLVAYKKAQADYKDASAVVDGIREKISKIGSIDISSNLSIDKHSSEKQFLYALGIVSNQAWVCPLLGIPETDNKEKVDQVTALWNLMQELKAWVDYARELRNYEHALEDLLDNDDKFQLLEYPVKK